MKFIPVSIMVTLILASYMIILPNIVEGTEQPFGNPSDLLKGNQNEKGFSNELTANYFIENRGQIAEDDHIFCSASGDVRFLPDGVLMRFRDLDPIYDDVESDPFSDPFDERAPTSYHERGVVLKYSFLGSKEVIPYGRERCSWNTNYFRGSDPDSWYSDVPNYKEIVYPNVWDGIDIVYKLEEGNIKYDIVVSAGADPDQIQFKIDGADNVFIDRNGNLKMRNRFSDVFDSGLVAFYEDESSKKIDVKFKLPGKKTFGIALSDYDHSQDIIIDPLVYSTYIGGSGRDSEMDIVVDSQGNSYIAGISEDATTNYPTTPGAYETNHPGSHPGRDSVFVTKVDQYGSSLIFSTFLGESDKNVEIDVDPNGNPYIVGTTLSFGDFPTTPDAYDTSPNGFKDLFVTKLNPSGSDLIYSTLIGGSGTDLGEDIVVDSSGSAYITGKTLNETINYPTTANAYDTFHNGDWDVFVTKLDPTGSSLIYSTFLGGNNEDGAQSIALYSDMYVYITGDTYSSNFPTTSGSYDTQFNELFNTTNDVFVSKLNPSGSDLIYSTYLGGESNDYGNGIAVDSTGSAFVIGKTRKYYSFNFPTTSGAYDTSHNGGKNGDRDVFVTKLNPEGSSLSYSTFIGGSKSNDGRAIDINNDGYAYLTGTTSDVDFPTTSQAVNLTHNGGKDVFVTKLSPDGSSLSYSTFLGGPGEDIGYGIDLNSNGNIYLTGWSGGGGFPTTTGSFDESYNGDGDVFVTVLYIDTSPPTFVKNRTPETGTTGENFTFEIDIADDFRVNSSFVEYWFGYGHHNNKTMSGTSNFSHTITIPEDSTDMLHYIFSANDYSGNWARSVISNVTVTDNDPPIFGNDTSMDNGKTGDSYTFDVFATDNIGISSVSVEYWFGSDPHSNISLEGNNPYTITIMIPNNYKGPLHYQFQARDESGNLNRTAVDTVQIIDDDKPMMIRDLTPTEIATGDDIDIRVDLIDNIEIRSVIIEYWFGTGERIEKEMVLYEGIYEYTISIPMDSLDPLYYVVSFNDTSDNLNSTSKRKIDIIDTIDPEIKMVDDIWVYLGEDINVQINATDNIGISKYKWEGNPVSASGSMMSGIPSETGEFGVSLVVSDESGNEASINFNITVLPEDHDNDNDGIPDLIERDLGLDMNSSSDSSLDPDNDGLSNLEEYLNGTDINNEDTDGDGMPDGWEVENNLDPVTYSADIDTDGDGMTDLEEYQNGTDPNVRNESDEPDDDSISPLLIIIILLVIIIGVIGGIGIYLLLKKNRSDVEDPEDQPMKNESFSSDNEIQD